MQCNEEIYYTPSEKRPIRGDSRSMPTTTSNIKPPRIGSRGGRTPEKLRRKLSRDPQLPLLAFPTSLSRLIVTPNIYCTLLCCCFAFCSSCPKYSIHFFLIIYTKIRESLNIFRNQSHQMILKKRRRKKQTKRKLFLKLEMWCGVVILQEMN